MPTISCAMIVKDSESTLLGALESVRPHVDELVIVDTGSTDGTRRIARRYADRMGRFKWRDDFSAARQRALDLCSGDWCMWLDSDDQLVGGEHLRAAVAAAPENLNMYMMRYVTAENPAGRPIMEFWRERLLRRGKWRWVGRVHEVLVPLVNSPYDRLQAAHVVHRGHGDHEASLRRNIALLRLSLAEEPTNTRTLFYLGRDLVTVGDLDEGRQMLERYVAAATWPDERMIAQQIVGYCHRAQGRHQEAYIADLMMLAIQPRWPHAYFSLAEDCYHLQRWDWSVHWSEIGQALPAPDTNLFLNRESLEFEWMIYQVVALWNSGRQLAAIDLTRRALAVHPDNPLHLANMAFFRSLVPSPAEAEGA